MFEWGEPIEVKLFREDPAIGLKLLWFLHDIDFGSRIVDLAKEVGLFLAVTAVFADFFEADVWGVEIAVIASMLEDGVVVGQEADFFLNFTEKCFLE